MYKLPHPDINSEFFIQHHLNGIKLVREETLKKQNAPIPAYRVSTLLCQLPLRSFFLSTEHVVLAESKYSLEFNTLLSLDTIVGQTVLDLSDRASALRTFENDNIVMKTQTSQIYEESPIINDKPFNFLCFKMPCYNEQSKLVGIFNSAIPIGYQSLAETIPFITNLGFLNSYQHKKEWSDPCFAKGRVINNVYLTRREQQCIYHLIRGKSAKIISRSLGLSPRTVEGYLDKIKNKTGTHSKYELIDMFVDYC